MGATSLWILGVTPAPGRVSCRCSSGTWSIPHPERPSRLTNGLPGARPWASGPSTSSPCSARPSSSRSSWGWTPTSRSCSRGSARSCSCSSSRTRCPATSAPARRSSPASRRSAALDEGNDSSYVTGAILVGGLVLAAVGLLVHFGGAVADPQAAAAGRHRRGRHADRLQPRSRRRQHLLAPGPVGRAPDRHVHGGGRGDAARVLVADRRLPRPDLRLPALVAVRRGLRPHQLRGAGARRRDRARPVSGRGTPSARPTGSACRAARWPTASPSSTARRSP